MSFAMAAPEFVEAAASDLASIGSTISAASIALQRVSAMTPALAAA